jgi:hypothetical protein
MVLQRHIGRNNGIKAKDLAAAADAERARGAPAGERAARGRDRRVRPPSTGYYVAKSADELEKTCEYLRSRAMHSLRLESRLRKIPLPDLIGQLRLKT